jgi:putative membrane protein
MAAWFFLQSVSKVIMNDWFAKKVVGARSGESLRLRAYGLWALLQVLIIIYGFPSPAFGHKGEPHTLTELSQRWSFDPLVVVGLAFSVWLYFRGLRRLWRESAVGQGIKRWQAASFACGWAALFIALISPLHTLGEVLFSAHMVQHEVLMLIAAPLIVLGRPLITFLWAVPMRWRKQLGRIGKAGIVETGWRALTNPLAAWAIHGLALWVWHVPALFQATLESDLVHTAQHLSFFLSALLFWWALIYGRQALMGYGVAVLYVFSTAMHSGLLGVLLTFTTKLWYPVYREFTGTWGLTPMEDQQLGGLIMWIPAGVVYVIAGLILFTAWLQASERRVLAKESRRQEPATDWLNR